MALPDPVTIAARAPMPSIVYTRTRMDGYGGEYVDSGGNGVTLVISHNPGKNGNRHYVRVVQTKNATNPYSGLTQSVVASASLALVRPAFGFTDAEMTAVGMLLFDTVQDSEVTFAKLLQNQP